MPQVTAAEEPTVNGPLLETDGEKRPFGFDLVRIVSRPRKAKSQMPPCSFLTKASGAASLACLERDLHFRPTKTLSEYAQQASRAGGIRA